MALTLYQKSYIKALSGAAKTTYINSVYDTYSEGATQPTSKYATKKAKERGNVHAYTKKLTDLTGSQA